MLHGRDQALRMLSELLERAGTGEGGALVLRGETGIGKSALLAWATSAAADLSMRPMSTAGVPAEATVRYAALHRLLGEAFDAVAQPYRVALDALDLVRPDPAGPAVLMVVDDAQWLDEPSWEALAFLGRRLRTERVLLLLGVRDGQNSELRLAGAGLPELRLEPLGEHASGALLDEIAPDLPTTSRERVLDNAAGNPLGLVEFAAAVARFGPGTLLPQWLPLSTRVERSFAILVGELPLPTRVLLLVAALDDGDSLEEMLAAGSRLGDGPIVARDIEPAVAAGLVSMDDGFRVRMRHPLLRSALRQGAGAGQRRAVHAALAEVMAGNPDRRVWHRAATATGPDEVLARELTEAATRLRPRDPGAARAALERAAELTADAGRRSSRLLAAVEIAEQQGNREDFVRLLAGLDPFDLSPAEQARLSWFHEVSLAGSSLGPSRDNALAAIAEALARQGDTEWAAESLLSLAVRWYLSNPDGAGGEQFVLTASRLGLPATDAVDARLLCVLAVADPVGRGPAILQALREHDRGVDTSPRQLCLLGSAATGIGAFFLGTRLFAAGAAGLRAQGRRGTLTWALTGQAFNAAMLGDTRLVIAAATEAGSLAAESGQSMPAVLADLSVAQVEALRGNASAALELAGRAERALLSAGAGAMRPMADLVRGTEALASGRPAESFDHLIGLVDPVVHPHLRFAALAPLAEAAAACGRQDRLRALVREWEGEAGASPMLDVALPYATAVLAPEELAGDAFEAALAADLSVWPLERARLGLAYGRWLRRRRRVQQSRPLLRNAAVVFDALGATAWAGQARRELRATGESQRRSANDTSQTLTAQEVQVARLAAEGLSNRDIAERLFISPRTVTTHLSRIFPKLGITSRRELPAAIAEIT